MKVVKSYIELDKKNNGIEMLKSIERAARTCYKSEGHITEESYKPFIKNLLKRGHLSTIEHKSVTTKIVCDRGVSHELVRHRLFSFSQESTRYCNYKGFDIEFVEPLFFKEGTDEYNIWKSAMEFSEQSYNALIGIGCPPQEARTVLPNSLKTEIVITGNIRNWRLFFELRCNQSAHPQMVEIAIPLLKEMSDYIPIIFDDLKEKYIIQER